MPPAIWVELQHFAEVVVYVLKHIDDGQIVRAAGFACAALYTGVGLYGHALITAYCPVSKAIAGKVTVYGEAEGNINANGTGLAVIASAAELTAKSIADTLYLRKLGLGEGSGVGGCLCVLRYLCF